MASNEMTTGARPLVDRSGRTALIAFGLAIVLCSVLWLLFWTRFGLDFTDEGFYLNFLATPSAYRASTTQFGFVYAPFFAALGRNVVLARQANVILTLSLAIPLFYLLAPRSRLRPADRLGWLAVSSLLAFAALISMTLHQTPSYNSLNLQALLAAGLAFILIRDADPRRAMLGSALLGLAGSIAFAAKPPTGASLAFVALAYLLYCKGRDLRYLAVATAAALVLMLVLALLVDGSVTAFIDRLVEGFRLNQLLQGYTLKILSPFDRLWPGIPPMLLWIGCLVFGFAAASLALSKARFSSSLALAIGLLCSAGAFAIIIGYRPDRALQGVMLIGFHCGVVLAAAVRRFGLERGVPLPWDELALAVALGSLPLIYALGTNTNFWAMAAKANVFWAAAAVLALTSLHPRYDAWRTVLPVALISHAITICVLYGAVLQPFLAYQPSWMNNRIIDFGPYGQSPILASRDAAYLSELRARTTEGGFKPGMPIIDLTGEFPTALFAINALPIGQAWTIGGYEGSAMRAKAALRLVPCETIAQAWLLAEPQSPRTIDATAIDLGGYQYVQVATIASPRRKTLQYLMKPGDPAANGALCRERRTGNRPAQ